MVNGRRATIFAVHVLDRWLLYAPIHGICALVNRSALDQIVTGTGSCESDIQWIRDELRSPAAEPQPMAGEIAPQFLGFITTRACNIGCVYCDFGGPTAKKVDIAPEIVVSAIDWMAERLRHAGRQRFHVHLFGGEPFHAPEMVDLIVHRTRAVCAQNNLSQWIDVSTNGVFNEARARFVADYIDGVVLSLDGPAEVHDKNRPAFDGRPTFAAVERTARRLSKSSVELCLRACVTQDSVNNLEQITDWMCREFQPRIVTFEPLTENPLSLNAGLRAPDPYAFTVNWMHSYRLAKRRGVKLVYSAIENEQPRLSSCPVGTDTVIVSPDGRASACYLMPEDWKRHGMNMDVGWVRPHGTMDIDPIALDGTRNLIAQKPRCQRCLCQWNCAGGCHVSHSFLNCPESYNSFCVQTRLITVCSLLERLGATDLVDRLLSNQSAMERLAMNEWDGLTLESASDGFPSATASRHQLPMLA